MKLTVTVFFCFISRGKSTREQNKYLLYHRNLFSSVFGLRTKIYCSLNLPCLWPSSPVFHFQVSTPEHRPCPSRLLVSFCKLNRWTAPTHLLKAHPLKNSTHPVIFHLKTSTRTLSFFPHSPFFLSAFSFLSPFLPLPPSFPTPVLPSILL